MKIYTNGKEISGDLKYWCNSCGDTFDPHKSLWISEDKLPTALRDAYTQLWQENPGGSYCYLVEYRGQYGIALVNEYYEIDEDGVHPDINNYDRAVVVGKMLEKRYPQHTVFLVTNKLTSPREIDRMAELFVFLDTTKVSKEEFDELANFLWHNAYLKQSMKAGDPA